ncbi:MAG: hypothetical protein JWM58_357 [Rhizobium sp.]|nr:hypothetical protein [Rhizobium sp.]
MTEMKVVVCAGTNSRVEVGKRQGWVALYGLDLASGKAREITRSKFAPSPSFLAWSAGKSSLYIASEIASGDGRVTSLSLSDHAFIEGNHAATGGNGAVHLCLDRQGKFLFAANYQSDDTSGPVSVAVFPLKPDGSLGTMVGSARHQGHGPDHSRQSRPHCHSVMISPDNRIVAAADLGTDSLYLYHLNATNGTIALAQQIKLPPGTGPRHSVFHPSLPFLYLTGELNSSLVTITIDTVSAEAHVIDSTNATATGPEGRNYPSGIAMTPDGHYVLVANRGADMISVFWIDPESGRPTLRSEVACGGRFPRAIRFDPSARYLAVANQKSDDISIFGWDFTKGVLSGKPLIKIDLQTPLDMIFAD